MEVDAPHGEAQLGSAQVQRLPTRGLDRRGPVLVRGNRGGEPPLQGRVQLSVPPLEAMAVVPISPAIVLCRR
jgi:hypothetical protein